MVSLLLSQMHWQKQPAVRLHHHLYPNIRGPLSPSLWMAEIKVQQLPPKPVNEPLSNSSNLSILAQCYDPLAHLGPANLSSQSCGRHFVHRLLDPPAGSSAPILHLQVLCPLLAFFHSFLQFQLCKSHPYPGRPLYCLENPPMLECYLGLREGKLWQNITQNEHSTRKKEGVSKLSAFCRIPFQGWSPNHGHVSFL